MADRSSRARGFTRSDAIALAVLACVFAFFYVPVLLSPRHRGQPARRAKCGSQLKTFGLAYQMWAGDHQNFWPPRCKPKADCPQREIESVGEVSEFSKRSLRYSGDPFDGLGVVGSPLLKSGISEGSTDPRDYHGTDRFPLNRWVLPNWKVGMDFDIARCPSDMRSLIAPEDVDIAGVEPGSPASSFEIHGTSYVTNIQPELPWRGHGPWVEKPQNSKTPIVGPNFNPEKINNPSGYVITGDLGVFHESWAKCVGAGKVGKRSKSGRWHEQSDSDPWTHGNMLYGDLHVQWRKFTIPFGSTTTFAPSSYGGLYPYQISSTSAPTP